MRRLAAFAIRLVLHPLWRLTRGQTFGARALIVDGEGKVLLVEHTYIPGWHFPGGGVEHGESAGEAIEREIVEEASIRASAPPALFGLYTNFESMRGDHVALYVIADWQPSGEPRRRFEIARTGFFPPGDLPPGTTAGTRRRIEEWLAGAVPARKW